MKKFYNIKDDRLILQITLQPGAKKDEIVGIYGNSLKIRISAPAIEGKANRALIKFLAKKFSVMQKDVILQKGVQSKNKQIIIRGIETLPDWFKTTLL